MNLFPRNRWWHWIVYPVGGILVAMLLAGAVIVTVN